MTSFRDRDKRQSVWPPFLQQKKPHKRGERDRSSSIGRGGRLSIVEPADVFATAAAAAAAAEEKEAAKAAAEEAAAAAAAPSGAAAPTTYLQLHGDLKWVQEQMTKNLRHINHEVEVLDAHMHGASHRKAQQAAQEAASAAAAAAERAMERMEQEWGKVAARRRLRATAKVNIIPARPKQAIVFDMAQEDSDGSQHSDPDLAPHGSATELAAASDGGVSEEEELGLPGREQVDDAEMEGWRLDTAHENMEYLMGNLNTEERSDILEVLGSYFEDKLHDVRTQTQALDKKEFALASEGGIVERAAEVMLEAIDEREAGLYKLMRRYYQKLHTLVRREVEKKEELLEKTKRTQELRSAILAGGHGEVMMHQDVLSEAVAKGEVTPPQLMAVVAGVQEDVEALRSLVRLELERKSAYEHAHLHVSRAVEREVDNSLEAFNRDPVTSYVISEVVAWERSGNTDDAWNVGGPREESAFATIHRLGAESTRLKAQIAAEEQIIRNHQSSRRGSIDVPDLNVPKLEPGMMPWDFSKWRNYQELSKDVQELYEAELLRIQEGTLQVERQIFEFQEIKKLTESCVPVIEESSKRLTAVAAEAKKNINLSSLPEDDDEDEVVLKRLKAEYEELNQQQEAEYIEKLRALRHEESRLKSEVRQTERDAIRLASGIEAERDGQRQNREEIFKLKQILDALHADILRLQTAKEHQTSNDIWEVASREMAAQAKKSKKKLQAAIEKVETQAKVYEKSKATALEELEALKSQATKAARPPKVSKAAEKHAANRAAKAAQREAAQPPSPKADRGLDGTGGAAVREARLHGQATPAARRLGAEETGLVSEGALAASSGAGGEVPPAESAMDLMLSQQRFKNLVAFVKVTGLRHNRHRPQQREAADAAGSDEEQTEETSEMVGNPADAGAEGKDAQHGAARVGGARPRPRPLAHAGTGGSDSASGRGLPSPGGSSGGGAQVGGDEALDSDDDASLESGADEAAQHLDSQEGTQLDARASAGTSIAEAEGAATPPAPPPIAVPALRSRAMQEKVDKLLEEARRDEDLSAELEAKAAELSLVLARLEALVAERRGGGAAELGEALRKPPSVEVPSHILAMRRELEALKQLRGKLRQSWSAMRQKMRRSPRKASGGEEVRKEIVAMCNAALEEAARHRHLHLPADREEPGSPSSAESSGE